MPEISVIMSVYNQLNREQLFDAVRSILNQTFHDFELIIYDDGSCREAARLLLEVGQLDRRIRLIGQNKNHGLGFSLNACIKAAKGKYIARMDADDISYSNRLMIQKRFLDEHEEISWCGCNTELFDDGGIWGRREMPERPKQRDFLKYSPFVHPTVMYRREVLEECDGYAEERENLRCEDYEIFMRLQNSGFQGANIQQYLFGYREDYGSYKKRTVKNRFREARCRLHGFQAMHILFPTGWFFVLRPIFAALLPVRVLSLLKRRESAIHNKRKEGGQIGQEEAFNAYDWGHAHSYPDCRMQSSI